MKKLILAGAVLVAFSANAQFGINASGIMSKVKNTYSDNGTETKDDTKNMFSFKAGLVYNLPLTEYLQFMPQLNYIRKGGKLDNSSVENVGGSTYTYKVKGNMYLNYLELPLNVVYNLKGSEGGFFIGAGPVLSYGLNGKVDADRSIVYGGATSTEHDNTKIKFDGKKDATDSDEHLKAFELGIDGIAGYRFANGFFVKGEYNLGLSNINPVDNYKTKNSYFGIGLGMFLSAK